MFLNSSITIITPEQLQQLLYVSLCKNYNKKSKIRYENSQLELSIYFEETPPEDLVITLGHFGVQYLDISVDTSDVEVIETATPEKSAILNSKNETASQVVEAKSIATSVDTLDSEKNSKSTNTETQAIHQVKLKDVVLPKGTFWNDLKQNVFEKSKSFEELINNAISFFSIEQNDQSAFRDLLNTYNYLYTSKVLTGEQTKVTWNDLCESFTKKGINFTPANKKHIWDAITGLSNENTTKVLKILIHFSVRLSKLTDLEKTTASEKTAKEEIFSKKEITAQTQYIQLFKCMPTLVTSSQTEKVKHIENSIRTIDKSIELSKRISEIILLLGDTTYSDDITHIEYCKSLLNMKEINPDKLTIPKNHFLLWAKRVRLLANMYNPNNKNPIHVADFLNELRQYIMTEDELAALN